MTGAGDADRPAAEEELRAARARIEDLEAQLHESRRAVESLTEIASVAGRVELLRRELDRLSARLGAEATFEDRVRDLQAQLNETRRKLRNLQGRRIVRLALRVAAIAGPLYRAPRTALRRLRARSRERASSRRRQDRTEGDVAGDIRRLRATPSRVSGPLVSIVVLTRDGRHHMERLLAGLRDRTEYRTFELIVVDNGSSDGTAELLARRWPFSVQVIRNEENKSFSEGNNQGIAHARGEYVLLLNNDVDPINAGWLGAMVGALESSPRRAAAGALLVYPSRPRSDGVRPDNDLAVQHRGIGFFVDRGAPRARNLGVGDDPTDASLAETRAVPAVTAACMLVRRDSLDAVEGLTEGYVYGTEDVDLCLKLRAAGGEIVLCGEAALFHHEFGTQDRMEPEWKRDNRRRNWQLFAERWAPALVRSVRLDQLSGEGRWTGRPGRTAAIVLTADDASAGWGDWATAHELGDALAAQGWEVVYVEAKDHPRYVMPEHADLLISLLDRFDVRAAPPSAFTVAWVRNWTDRWIARPWFEDYDLIVASSAESARVVRERSRHHPEVLPLAANPARFRPLAPDPSLGCDIAFTGSNWGSGRRTLEWLDLRPGERFALYGKGWEGVAEAEPHWRGFLDWASLPALYSSARIVLDDTAEHTLPYGAVNARAFEALASGALPVTNNVAGSWELFDGLLPAYSSAAQLRALLDRFLGDEDARRRRVEALRRVVLERHTYARRAEQLVELAQAAVRRPNVALKIATSNRAVAEEWGDTHFARDFAAALRRQGFGTRIDYRADWDDPSRQDADVVVQLRGLHVYRPKAAHLNVIWMISHPEDVPLDEYERFHLVLVASRPFAEQLHRSLRVPVRVLLQATDTARFRPVPPDPELHAPLLFVGGSRNQERAAVKWSVELGLPLAIYGSRWEQFVPQEYVRAHYFPNERLHELYCSADVVLADHWPDMARLGFVSNRIFDVLACGGFVVSDAVEGLRDLLADTVPQFGSREELGALVERFLADPAQRRALADEGMRIVRAEHSFDARAKEFASLVRPLLGARPATFDDLVARPEPLADRTGESVLPGA